jgi:hypothetical protein
MSQYGNSGAAYFPSYMIDNIQKQLAESHKFTVDVAYVGHGSYSFQTYYYSQSNTFHFLVDRVTRRKIMSIKN